VIELRGLVVALVLLTSAHAHAYRSSWPSLSGSQRGAHRDGSQDAAVIVALEQYASLPGIPGARKNGDDWYAYFTHTLDVPSEHVIKLYDHNARDYQIANVVEEMSHKVGPGGRLWFVFIGHGATGSDKNGLLVGYEADASETGLENRSVHQPKLLETLAQAPQAVAILDACYSGRTSSGVQLARGLMPAVFVAESAPSNVVVLTAASADEFAGALPGVDRPAFSYLTLGGLRGWADHDRDGRITAAELRDYTSDTLTKALAGTRSQHPTLSADDAAIVLAQGEERGPNLDDIVLDQAPPRPELLQVVELSPRPSPMDETDRLIERPHTGIAGRAVALSLFGAGVTTSVIGLGFWQSSHNANAQLRTSCPSVSSCDPSQRGKYDDAQQHARVGNYLVPIGAGVAIVALTGYLISRAHHRVDVTHINLVLNREGGVLSYRGRL
jgi:hypothetical protein